MAIFLLAFAVLLSTSVFSPKAKLFNGVIVLNMYKNGQSLPQKTLFLRRVLELSPVQVYWFLYSEAQRVKMLVYFLSKTADSRSFIGFSNPAGSGCWAVQGFNSQNPCIFHGTEISWQNIFLTVWCGVASGCISDTVHLYACRVLGILWLRFCLDGAM